MLAGSHVTHVEMKEDHEVGELANEILSRLFPEQWTRQPWSIVKLKFKRWGADIFSRGAYSYDAVDAHPDQVSVNNPSQYTPCNPGER
jgi:hypothetical protein